MPDHPVVKSAKREAILVLSLWAIACAFTVGYCCLRGYGGTLADTNFIFGFPEWVFVGIVAPWIFWSAVSTLVANWVITDDDLGEEADAEEPRS